MAGLVNVTLWFVSNGWLGKKILWVGVETIFLTSPSVENAVEPKPTTVPTPIDSWGLKNTWSFNLELKSVTPSPVNFKSKRFGIKSIGVPTVCTPDDKPLLTLNILLGLMVLRTKSFSVPIPILLPTDIKEGILETYISVTIPVVDEFGISWYTIVCVVSIPILNVLFNSDADVVLNPDITTRSLLLRVGAVDIKADTPSDSFLINTTFS